MSDSASIARLIWDVWLSDSVKRIIVDGVGNKCCRSICMEDCARLYIFLAAAHDLGKATPAFQNKIADTRYGRSLVERIRDAGLGICDHLENPGAVPHATASELILERNGISRMVSVIVGGHHGTPPSEESISRRFVAAYPKNTGFEDRPWIEAQNDLLTYCLNLANMSEDFVKNVSFSIQAQVELSGLVIMADWIASNKMLFPYASIGDGVSDTSEKRALFCWDGLRLPSFDSTRDDSPRRDFEEAFRFSPRPFQIAVGESADEMDSPGIMILEAAMGEGKTEAALHAAEIFSKKFGCKGVFFALPTQATSDSIFPRIEGWAESRSDDCHTVFLAHGKSRYNLFYEGLPQRGWSIGDGSSEGVIVHQWFSGKKGILSDYVVGTVDQILMAGLKTRHLALRHLGISEKVVIIDECHAYDEYMGSYLEKVVRWLGTYRVPTIIMSATLPESRRTKLLMSYMGIKSPPADYVSRTDAYPLITYSDGCDIKSICPDSAAGRNKRVHIHRITDEELISTLKEQAADGGYVGIILNTVARSQRVADMVSEIFPDDDVILLHSGFTSIDRSYRESKTVEMLKHENRKSAPYRMIVVGTQVMEQSLDLDFDVVFSDLCPIDLLIQRIGRLHRHDNIRPMMLSDPSCYIIDTGIHEFEKGSEYVYGRYQLMNTRLLLDDHIQIPDDIPRLVQAAYSDHGVGVGDDMLEEYDDARSEMDREKIEKERKAKVYQILPPHSLDNLVGWLDHPPDNSEANLEARVRDTQETVEVTLVMKGKDGLFRVLPWVPEHGGSVIPSDVVPDDGLAFAVAGCRVRLPNRIVRHVGADELIKNLKASNLHDMPKCWEGSSWLSGELFITLDEDFTAEIMGYTMRYSEDKGVESNE